MTAYHPSFTLLLQVPKLKRVLCGRRGGQLADTFDYVIIGAGSAGCILANRLTADGKHTVCLLEAGPPIGIPIFISRLALSKP